MSIELLHTIHRADKSVLDAKWKKCVLKRLLKSDVASTSRTSCEGTFHSSETATENNLGPNVDVLWGGATRINLALERNDLQGLYLLTILCEYSGASPWNDLKTIISIVNGQPLKIFETWSNRVPSGYLTYHPSSIFFDTLLADNLLSGRAYSKAWQ